MEKLRGSSGVKCPTRVTLKGRRGERVEGVIPEDHWVQFVTRLVGKWLERQLPRSYKGAIRQYIADMSMVQLQMIHVARQSK